MFRISRTIGQRNNKIHIKTKRNKLPQEFIKRKKGRLFSLRNSLFSVLFIMYFIWQVTNDKNARSRTPPPLPLPSSFVLHRATGVEVEWLILFY